MNTAEVAQKEYADIYGYDGIWDRYSGSDDEILAFKLRKIFPRIPQPEEDEEVGEEEINRINRDNETLTDQRNNIFRTLWAKRIYCEGNLKIATIYVLWTQIPENNQPIKMARNSTSYKCHPVFRVWKCSLEGNSEDCCNIFIDENSRVYKNWKDFIKNNIYPQGVLVAPKKGIYKLNRNRVVQLECHFTPNSTMLRKTTRVVDVAAGSLGAVSAVTVFIPFPPVVLISMIVGASTTAYTMGRSIDNLVDKGEHGQSISLLDRQARLDWFNIISSTVSLGATGATIGAVCHIARGKTITQGVEKAIGGINATAIAVNGINVANSTLETANKLKNSEEFSRLEILQLSQSLVLFTHSIHNWTLAVQMIKKSNGEVPTQTMLRESIREQQSDFVNNTATAIQRLKGSKYTNIDGPDIFRYLSSIPDCLSLLFGVGLPVLSKLEYDYVLDKIKEIIDKFFVASKIALDNCVTIISKIMNFCNEGINYMLQMAEEFLDEVKNVIETRIRPLIPFENVLWDIFNISATLQDLTVENMLKELHGVAKITVEFLKENYTQIMNALKKLYSEYFKQNPSRKIKCNLCDGFYEKCELRD